MTTHDPLAALPAPLRPYARSMAGSWIRAVTDAAFGTQGVIPLWFGESDKSTPPFIVEAAERAMREGKMLYAPNRGIDELRVAIAEYETGLGRRKVEMDRVTVLASGVNAIMQVMQCIVDPGDNIVLVTPLWPNCADAVQALNGEARRVVLTPGERGWSLDLDRLFAACDARTRAIFVNSPGNPTGWLATRDEQQAILDFCRQRRIWVVADEVYERIIYDRPCAPSFLDLAGPDDPVIQVNSFSKAWCMTGWRLGWAIAPPALGPVLAKVNEFNMSSATTFVQHAGVTAIRKGEGFVREIVADYGRARDLVVQRLGAIPRVRLMWPEAAFYAFFRVDGMNDSLTAAQGVVREAKVGLAPGIAFGPEAEGWLRMCYAVSLPRLSQALDRLAEHLR